MDHLAVIAENCYKELLRFQSPCTSFEVFRFPCHFSLNLKFSSLTRIDLSSKHARSINETSLIDQFNQLCN